MNPLNKIDQIKKVPTIGETLDLLYGEDKEMEEPTPEEIEEFWQSVQDYEANKDYAPNLYTISYGEKKQLSPKLLECSFETYEAKNKFQQSALEDCIDFSKNKKKRTILLCGTVGTGKTHLAISIMKSFPKIKNGIVEHTSCVWGKKNIQHYRRVNCLYLPFNRFQDELEDARQNGSKDRTMEMFIGNDCICLDDLRIEDTTPANRKNIFTLLNGLYEKGKKVIVTSNSSFQQIKDFDDRIADRIIDNGMVIAFNFESFRKVNR